jgi:hypothetical protein
VGSLKAGNECVRVTVVGVITNLIMPIAGTGREAIPGDNPKPFFRDLSQLDAWASEPKGNSTTVLPYVPRNRSDDPYVASRGKLLVRISLTIYHLHTCTFT